MESAEKKDTSRMRQILFLCLMLAAVSLGLGYIAFDRLGGLVFFCFTQFVFWTVPVYSYRKKYASIIPALIDENLYEHLKSEIVDLPINVTIKIIESPQIAVKVARVGFLEKEVLISKTVFSHLSQDEWIEVAHSISDRLKRSLLIETVSSYWSEQFLIKELQFESTYYIIFRIVFFPVIRLFEKSQINLAWNFSGPKAISGKMRAVFWIVTENVSSIQLNFKS
jgi:hypothetical protein